MRNKRKIIEKITVVALSLFMISGLLPANSIIPIVIPIPVKAADPSEEEEKTAYVPLTYTMQSYPKGDDVEYKLTISKKMYPTSSVSFSQIGKGVLTYPIDMNVSVVLGGSLVTKRIQQTVKVDTDTGEFTITDSTIETITGVMDSKTQINVYGESKVPEGKHEVDPELYEKEYDPKAFFDIGGEDAINQMKMSFVDAITGTEMTTQLSTHMTLWQKNNTTGLPILRTLQVIYLFKDIDTCNDENYTEGTCPEKGEHTFIQTKDSYYFAVDEITRNIFLEQGTQTRYKLKWVSDWSDWNHEESDRVWEDNFPNENTPPNPGDDNYLTDYPRNSIVLDQRDYKVYWQHIEEGKFQREFSHDWSHKYIFQKAHLGGVGYVDEAGHPASGMTIKFAMYAKQLKDGNGKSSEYYLSSRVDAFGSNSDLMGSGSWYNGDGKDNASSIGGNTIYNTAEKFTLYNDYCDMNLSFSNGCRYKWYDSIEKTIPQNENGNNSCVHYHNTIRDNNNVCADPNYCTEQTPNCNGSFNSGTFYQKPDPHNGRNIREGSKSPKTCSVGYTNGSYRTASKCFGCKRMGWVTYCIKESYYWDYHCGSRTCGSRGTSCCWNGSRYKVWYCSKDERRWECVENNTGTMYNSAYRTQSSGLNCGWTFPSGNVSTLSVESDDPKAPHSPVCGWTREDEATSYKHCGYKTAYAPTLRTRYFEVNDFTETSGLLDAPFIIQKSGVDYEVNRYPLKMTSSYSRGSSSLKFDDGWYQTRMNKVAKKNYDKNEIREDELVEATESWIDYVDVDTYREEWRTEYRWKNPISFDEKYTIDDDEARECATQTGRYSGPKGSCVILEQITTPKFVEQEVTEVLPGSRTSKAESNLSIAQVEARADLYAEGQYQLFVYQNTPTRNLAINNTVNSETGFIGQEVSTIKLKEDYQDSYISYNNRQNSIKSSAKTTFLTTFEIWDIYMYVVGHSRYANVSNPAFTLSGKTVIEYPFKFIAENGGIGCGPGLTPPEGGCPLGAEIQVTSLLLSNKIANKGMNSLVYTSLDGQVHYDDVINSNDNEITEALCRNPEDYFFTVKDYDDIDALVNMIIAEQHFNEKPKTNDYSNDSYVLVDKYGDDSNVDKIFEFLMNLENSDNSPAMLAIKRLEQTNIMDLLKNDREIPEETFKEACQILELEFDSPADLMAYYNKMKNAGLTIENINERYNISITPADLRTYITNYRASHDNDDVHNRLAFIDYETAGLVETFGIDGTTQNEKIKGLVTKMCNK